MTTKTLDQMTREVREVNTALGWRATTSSLGDLVALLHTEIAEATTAYRRWRLADPTVPSTVPSHPPKPEGVGAELADTLIRLIDLCDIHNLHLWPTTNMDATLADVDPAVDPTWFTTFPEYMSWLHGRANGVWLSRDGVHMLRSLLRVAARFGIDLGAEYERKIAHNRTREYQHGGTVSDIPTATDGPAAPVWRHTPLAADKAAELRAAGYLVLRPADAAALRTSVDNLGDQQPWNIRAVLEQIAAGDIADFVARNS